MADMTDELHRLAPFLLALAEHHPDGMGIATLDGTIIYQNRALRMMVGTDDTSANLTIYDLFTETDEADRMMIVVQQVAEHDIWHGMLTHRRQSDRVCLHVTMTVFAIRDADHYPQALGLFIRHSDAAHDGLSDNIGGA